MLTEQGRRHEAVLADRGVDQRASQARRQRASEIRLIAARAAGTAGSAEAGHRRAGNAPSYSRNLTSWRSTPCPRSQAMNCALCRNSGR